MNEFLMIIVHLGAEMPVHAVCTQTTLQDNINLFSKVLAPVYTLASSTGEAIVISMLFTAHYCTAS